MFTLVTGIVGRWRAVCVTALQRPNSDAAAIRIVVWIAAASFSVKVPLGYIHTLRILLRIRSGFDRCGSAAVSHEFTFQCNDKLKFYGIWVHLGIDGFSRRIIWLQAGTSNRKPGFIARYYLDAVIRENGCPQLVRADRGKENKLVALLQTSFRQRHCDSLAGINSFRYGKSVHNQRAECFNSYLKKSWICLWQERFEKMVGSDILDISNPVHIHCLQFSFLQLIQNELKLEAMEWNNHNIRKQRGVVGPFGKPELLYYSPPEGKLTHFNYTLVY
ncbi:unnamed protein product [Ranitomeya imitator]|uniref:Integrase core domain-containing protein n=1 Tax=Ranitomeya imitator TaxID=111125 RepID=A0ABN9KNM2_9NEOB|nr:unnamed protein product [Ranitomeya imitator]